MTLRITFVDDSIIIRKVVRGAIDDVDVIDGVDVIDVARDGITAVEKIIRMKPDLVTPDIEMPGLNRVGGARRTPTPQPEDLDHHGEFFDERLPRVAPRCRPGRRRFFSDQDRVHVAVRTSRRFDDRPSPRWLSCKIMICGRRFQPLDWSCRE